MDVERGFFIENILKDTMSKPSEVESSSEIDDIFSADPGTSAQIIGVSLPTAYPVISNRLDTHEGKEILLPLIIKYFTRQPHHKIIWKIELNHFLKVTLKYF